MMLGIGYDRIACRRYCGYSRYSRYCRRYWGSGDEMYSSTVACIIRNSIRIYCKGICKQNVLGTYE